MIALHDAFLYTFVMALAIFLCRALPFIVFRKISADAAPHGLTGKFIAFVERTAPPVTMTVLTFNALSSELAQSSPLNALPAAAGSALTALLHIWKRNALLSIAGGVIVYSVITYLCYVC